MATQIPDKTLQAALAEVEAELAEMAKAEKESALKKAREESGSPAGSPSASGSPSAEASAGGEAPPSAPGGEAPPSADPSAPPADGAAPNADPSAPPADPAAAPGAMPTLEQIVAEYSKLPPEELKLYYLGVKTALAQASGMSGSPMAPGAAPSAGPSAPPTAAPAPSAPPMPPMGKSESEKVMEASLRKSEAKQAEIEKDLATLSKALEMVIGQPQRKGVTGIEYVRRAAPAPEPEPAAVDPSKLSKSEMNLKLRHAVRSGKLSKSQMENVSKFSEGGMKDLDLVKDLFAVPTK